MGIHTTIVKLEPRSEVCIFVGYHKGTIGGMFYSAVKNKVFVSKNFSIAIWKTSNR